MTNWLTRTTTALSARPLMRAAVLAACYAVIIGGMFALYGHGEFNPPAFVYQAF